jgi:hypothetical protein
MPDEYRSLSPIDRPNYLAELARNLKGEMKKVDKFVYDYQQQKSREEAPE